MAAPANAEIESLMSAFYAAFDNRGGRAPAVAGLRALFGEGATITRVTAEGADRWDVAGFIAPRQAMLTDGTLTQFHEWETQAKTTVLENVASRWSTYRKAGILNGADYQGGGHKFIQLYRLGSRWVIGSILWEDS